MTRLPLVWLPPVSPSHAFWSMAHSSRQRSLRNSIRFATGCCLVLLTTISACAIQAQDEPAGEELFSGPQAGELLSEFEVQDLFADPAKMLTIAPAPDQPPQLIIFVHEISRPGIGLVRVLTDAVTKFPEPRPEPKLIFLSDDPTATRQWASNARRALPAEIVLGVSLDGPEGPGALGLNRNVAMTVLVVRGEEVGANFALVQPSATVDGPKILRALCEAAEGDWSKLEPTLQLNSAAPMRPQAIDDATFRQHVSPLLNRDASAEEIERIAENFERLARENPAFRERLIDAASRIVSAGKLENYGNEMAQQVLKRWADRKADPRPGSNEPNREAPPSPPQDQSDRS